VVQAIYLEVFPANLRRNNFTPDDCFRLLRDAGFRLFHCKDDDFRSGIAPADSIATLEVHGRRMRVAELRPWNSDFATDILAIHRSSEILTAHSALLPGG
jgi:hypothetical protein